LNGERFFGGISNLTVNYSSRTLDGTVSSARLGFTPEPRGGRSDIYRLQIFSWFVLLLAHVICAPVLLVIFGFL
jgi:hypothetical protein